jgi:hypothetical protein
MTAAAIAITPAPLTATDIFRARCEARALLYATSALELQEAVDILQHFATRTGLVEEIGQDAVQQVMADAFKRVRP